MASAWIHGTDEGGLAAALQGLSCPLSMLSYLLAATEARGNYYAPYAWCPAVRVSFSMLKSAGAPEVT